MIELTWLYAFNIIINTFFSFMTVALLIQLLVILLRVKQPRLRSLVLAIPLFKLPLDLYLYDFSRWALTYQINPYWALPGSRSFHFTLGWIPSLRFIPFTTLQLTLRDGKTFTLADMLALHLGLFWVKAIVLIVASISLIFFGRWLLGFYRASSLLTSIVNRSYICRRPINNSLLSDALRSAHIKLMVSPCLKVPCCFGVFTKYILIPETLASHVTQPEFEAIIAHEISHLTWYDAVVRSGFQAIAALFWWIPLKQWIWYIEGVQERACDSTVNKFALSPVDLAEALIKVARCAKQRYQPLPVASFFQAERITCRIDALLKEERQKIPSFCKLLHVVGVGSIVVIVVLGKFWIF